MMAWRDYNGLSSNGVDPITVSTVWHSFQTLVREMRDMVARTSQNYLMSQLGDLSVGFWMADGSTLAISSTIAA